MAIIYSLYRRRSGVAPMRRRFIAVTLILQQIAFMAQQ
jgi:hypothetical protein